MAGTKMAEPPATTDATTSSFAADLKGTLHEARTLLVKQWALAQAEMSVELQKTKSAAFHWAWGSTLLSQGLLLTLTALGLWIARGWETVPAWLGIVGGSLLGVGLATALVGAFGLTWAYQRSKQIHLVPERTLKSIQQEGI